MPPTGKGQYPWHSGLTPVARGGSGADAPPLARPRSGEKGNVQLPVLCTMYDKVFERFAASFSLQHYHTRTFSAMCIMLDVIMNRPSSSSLSRCARAYCLVTGPVVGMKSRREI